LESAGEIFPKIPLINPEADETSIQDPDFPTRMLGWHCNVLLTAKFICPWTVFGSLRFANA
jgi:hypothetical protein